MKTSATSVICHSLVLNEYSPSHHSQLISGFRTLLFPLGFVKKQTIIPLVLSKTLSLHQNHQEKVVRYEYSEPQLCHIQHNLSRRLGLSPRDVYQRLKRSGILTGYIIPSDHYLAEEIWQEHSA